MIKIHKILTLFLTLTNSKTDRYENRQAKYYQNIWNFNQNERILLTAFFLNTDDTFVIAISILCVINSIFPGLFYIMYVIFIYICIDVYAYYSFP